MGYLTQSREKTVNVYCYLSHVKENFFLSSVLVEIEKNVSSRSRATCKVPEAMLICFSKEVLPA